MGEGGRHENQPQVVGLHGRHHGVESGQQPGERGLASGVPSGLGCLWSMEGNYTRCGMTPAAIGGEIQLLQILQQLWQMEKLSS